MYICANRRKHTAGAFFTTYEAVKYTLGETSATTRARRSSQSQNETIHKFPILHSLPTPIVHAIASSTAEMVSCLMITPAEVLKQNAQVIEKSGGQQTAAIQVFSRFRHKPWKLWSGYAALVGRNLPFTGLHFPLFEYVRSHVVDWRQKEKRKDKDGNGGELGRIEEWNPVLERAVLTGFSAGLSGMVASIVTTPIDVVKTRVMLAASNGHISGGEERDAAPGPDTMKKIGTRGTVDVGKGIWENEGIKGLFKGGLIRAAWTAVSLGLYLSIYEAGRFYLEIRRKDRDGKVHKKEGEGVI